MAAAKPYCDDEFCHNVIIEVARHKDYEFLIGKGMNEHYFF